MRFYIKVFQLFSQAVQTFQTLLAAVRFLYDSFYNKDEITPFYHTCQLVFMDAGGLAKSAGLEQLRVDDESTGFPVKKLDAVS